MTREELENLEQGTLLALGYAEGGSVFDISPFYRRSLGLDYYHACGECYPIHGVRVATVEDIEEVKAHKLSLCNSIIEDLDKYKERLLKKEG